MTVLQSIRNIPAYVRAGTQMSAGQIFTKVARRATGITSPALSRLELLSDKKLGDPARVGNLFTFLEDQAREHAGWPGIELEGRNVMEIGCGALGGFSPVAMARGAASYAGIEPMWDDRVFFHPATDRKYLGPIANQLGMDITALKSAISDRCRFYKGTLEDWKPAQKADLVLSLSCLEHISDLDTAARNLRRLLPENAAQIHLVNFSNHRSKTSPFDLIYSMPPDAFKKRYGNLINLLRPKDVLVAFQRAGFNARFVPVSVRHDALDAVTVAPFWQDAYDRDELAVRTGFLLVDG